ncbi:MAG: DUF1080 domain-containing protein, partial [Verrucomicrobia bacterium]|nr:DUF1080 domain-containing protein [Verrucomicrobiota bacterium]
HFGDDPSLLGDYGWFLGNSDHRTHPVGEKRPNAWGLHDMHGNALEWCQDWFSTTYFAESPADDPPGPSSGSVRVERGGTPILYPVGCRSASRHYQESGKPNYIGAGFRLVCEIPTSAEPKSATTPSTPAALASQPPASSAQAPPSPPSAAAAPTTDSFQSLFNGRDLTGWTPREIMGRGDAVTYRPATGGWVIQNGELACVTTSSGYLKSDRQYGDFILQLEFKLHSDGNSGFYIRCSEPGNLAHRTGMRVFINGSIADLSRPTPRFLRPVGQWNSMQIRCEGDDVEVLVNGVRTASVNMSREAKLRDRPRSGHIGITNWDGEANGMTFRNIRIKELGAAPASAVLAPPPPPSATTVQTTDMTASTSQPRAVGTCETASWSAPPAKTAG